MTPLITDLHFVFAIAFWILLHLVVESPLKDGYHRQAKSFWESEELYTIATVIPEGIVLSYLTRVFLAATSMGGVFPDIPLGDIYTISLRVTYFSMVMMGLFTLRFFTVWEKTLDDIRKDVARIAVNPTLAQSLKPAARPIGFFSCILFGTGFGVAFVVATHPSVEVVEFLYQRHVNFAVFALRDFQAILGLQLVAFGPILAHMVSIFDNNSQLALKAGGLGAVGGILGGLFIPLILVLAMNAALIWGAFTGIILRSNIALESGLLTIPLSFVTTFGAHAFPEFVGIMVVGLGVGFFSWGLFLHSTGAVSSDWNFLLSSAKLTGVGFVIIGLAAFLETFISPVPLRYLKGYVTIRPTVLPLDLSPIPYLGYVAVILLTIAIFAVLTAGIVRLTVDVIDDFA